MRNNGTFQYTYMAHKLIDPIYWKIIRSIQLYKEETIWIESYIMKNNGTFQYKYEAHK